MGGLPPKPPALGGLPPKTTPKIKIPRWGLPVGAARERRPKGAKKGIEVRARARARGRD